MEERRYDQSIAPGASVINELFFAALDGPMMADPRLVRDIIMRKTKVRYNEPSNTPVCERCRHLHVETHDDMICPKCEAEDRLHEELGKIGKKVSLPKGISKPWQVRFDAATNRWILSTPDDFDPEHHARLFAEQLERSINSGRADSRTIELTVEPPVTPEHVQVSLDLPAPGEANANGDSFDRAALARATFEMTQRSYRASMANMDVLDQIARMEANAHEMAIRHQTPIRFAQVPGQSLAEMINRDLARETARRVDNVIMTVIDDRDDEENEDNEIE